MRIQSDFGRGLAVAIGVASVVVVAFAAVLGSVYNSVSNSFGPWGVILVTAASGMYVLLILTHLAFAWDVEFRVLVRLIKAWKGESKLFGGAAE